MRKYIVPVALPIQVTIT